MATATNRAADAQKYSVSVQWSDDDGEYVATSPEFDGLSGLGDSPEDAIRVLREAIEMALEVYADEGQPAPQPRTNNSDFSGQFRLRVPRHLHAALAAVADQEGVSLNTLAVSYLSLGIGRKTVRAAVRHAANEMSDIIDAGHQVPGSANRAARAKPEGVSLLVETKTRSHGGVSKTATASAAKVAVGKHVVSKNSAVVHGRDGRIRTKDSYGHDPNPPRDRKR